jgi:DNA-binding transcriptional MerR regulator
MLVYTINEVGQLLGVKPSTIRSWERRLGFDIKRDWRGNREIDEAMLEQLERIKSLRNRGYTLSGVRRILDGEMATPSPGIKKSGTIRIKDWNTRRKPESSMGTYINNKSVMVKTNVDAFNEVKKIINRAEQATPGQSYEKTSFQIMCDLYAEVVALRDVIDRHKD